MQDPNCLFCKIIAGKIPSKKVFEDEHVYAFHDIAPWAPIHFLMVPKLHIPSMAQITPEHSALMAIYWPWPPNWLWSKGAARIQKVVTEL